MKRIDHKEYKEINIWGWTWQDGANHIFSAATETFTVDQDGQN